MKIKLNKLNGPEKLVCDINNNNYVVHIRALKQALNHQLILKEIHNVIEFNQEARLNPYIEINTNLRTETKNDFQKDFFKLMNNAVFGKLIENVRKHRDIKFVTTNKRRKQLVLEPNYHTTKWFSEDLLATEMKKIKVKMNKLLYLGMSLLDISKTLMDEFWYDYIIPKYQNNAKLCYMDTDTFIIHIKTKDFFKDIADDVEKRIDASNYKVKYNSIDRPLPKVKNKKVIGLTKDELGGNIIIEFVAKTCSYLTDDDTVHKKTGKKGGNKKCVIKQILKFNDYKKCLFDKKPILQLQQRFKSEAHNLYTEEINKTALNSNGDKRL